MNAPRVRARVVTWPGPSRDGRRAAYEIRISGTTLEEARSLLGAAHRLGLQSRDGESITLCGPASRFEGLQDVEAVGVIVTGALERFLNPPRTLQLRGRTLNLERPRIVGILNATPDSFYDGGRYFGMPAALARADAMVAEGADLIEVGGESARPGPVVDVHEEARRVVPVVEALAGRLAVPIAVDTYKADVARRAVRAGAALINDISGLTDVRLAEIAADTGAALVVMHIQGRPKVHQPNPQYRSVADEVYAYLEDRTDAAREVGVPRSRILVDPGFSFGKAVRHDLEILRRLGEFRSLGYPIYLATSRKNYIRDVLGLPFEELLEGTAAAVAYGVMQGARLVRTHDVRFMRRLVRMLEAIMGPDVATSSFESSGTPGWEVAT